jgi:predicted kinase
MAGDSGTGKSTLALAIGRATGAVVLDKDVLQTALSEDGGTSANGMAYATMFALARSLLVQHHSVILDSPAYFATIREHGLDIATGACARYCIIESCCPDGAEQEQRLLRREHTATQPTSLAQAIAARRRPGIVPLSEPHLVLDTRRPLDVCVGEALAYLENDDQG